MCRIHRWCACSNLRMHVRWRLGILQPCRNQGFYQFTARVYIRLYSANLSMISVSIPAVQQPLFAQP